MRPLEEIEARANAATPGPWRISEESDDDNPGGVWKKGNSVYGIDAGEQTWHDNKGHYPPWRARYSRDEITVVQITHDRDYYYPEGAIENEADATFIAHARTDVPDLVEAVRTRDTMIRELLGWAPYATSPGYREVADRARVLLADQTTPEGA